MPHTKVTQDVLDTVAAQCVFQYTSTSVCTLYPWGGGWLGIDGVARQVPVAGVTLSNAALASNDVTYYVYAYYTGSAIALEVSTTVWSWTSSTGGIPIKAGDSTRTLVGMVRKVSGNFVYTASSKLVRSFWNDPGIYLQSQNGTAVVLSAAPFTEIDTGLRTTGLLWSNEAIEGTVHVCGIAAANLIGYASFGADASGTLGLYGLTQMFASSYGQVMASVAGYQATEGYHYFQVMGGVGSSSLTLVVSYCGMSIHTRRYPRS